jgi:hypothetical protein
MSRRKKGKGDPRCFPPILGAILVAAGQAELKVGKTGAGIGLIIAGSLVLALTVAVVLYALREKIKRWIGVAAACWAAVVTVLGRCFRGCPRRGLGQKPPQESVVAPTTHAAANPMLAAVVVAQQDQPQQPQQPEPSFPSLAAGVFVSAQQPQQPAPPPLPPPQPSSSSPSSPTNNQAAAAAPLPVPAPPPSLQTFPPAHAASLAAAEARERVLGAGGGGKMEEREETAPAAALLLARVAAAEAGILDAVSALAAIAPQTDAAAAAVAASESGAAKEAAAFGSSPPPPPHAPTVVEARIETALLALVHAVEAYAWAARACPREALLVRSSSSSSSGSEAQPPLRGPRRLRLHTIQSTKPVHAAFPTSWDGDSATMFGRVLRGFGELEGWWGGAGAEGGGGGGGGGKMG